MSISEHGGIEDSMSAVLIPGPEPAMTVIELRTIVAMTTADWMRCGHDEEKLRESAHLAFFFRGTPTITTDVVTYNVERRFAVVMVLPGQHGAWRVMDERTDLILATFENERHAQHYADRLEADPSLVDE